MRIPARFNGPPGSGNGGWCAGSFPVAAGATAGGPAFRVTLRLPPPLETGLVLRDGAVYADDALIAQVEADAETGDGPPPVPADVAARVAGDYPGFARHPFPGCYVCGPQRAEGDGLRIFPGLLPDGGTAAPWTVPAEVSVPVVWAALDCPGGWAAIAGGRTYVLGRIAASVAELPEPGSTCVVTGSAPEIDGRKAVVGTAVYNPDGRRIAVGRATWIAMI